MELRDYLQLIRKSWLMIAVMALIVSVGSALWAQLQPVKYEASATIVVTKPNTVPQRSANYFQYDKYYSIQASGLYADTLAAWLSSAGTAEEIFIKAGYPVPSTSIKKLGRIFKPRRQPPVTITLNLVDPDRDKAQKLVNAAVTIMKEKTDLQQKTDDPENYFNIINGPTVLAEVRPDLVINTGVGLLAGLVLGFIVAFLREYLRQEP
jgi:capsular polysaccharide biosynthesis protein